MGNNTAKVFIYGAALFFGSIMSRADSQTPFNASKVRQPIPSTIVVAKLEPQTVYWNSKTTKNEHNPLDSIVVTVGAKKLQKCSPSGVKFHIHISNDGAKETTIPNPLDGLSLRVENNRNKMVPLLVHRSFETFNPKPDQAGYGRLFLPFELACFSIDNIPLSDYNVPALNLAPGKSLLIEIYINQLWPEAKWRSENPFTQPSNKRPPAVNEEFPAKALQPGIFKITPAITFINPSMIRSYGRAIAGERPAILVELSQD